MAAVPPILVVDDFPDAADILCRLLRRTGYDAIGVTCGQQLLDYLDRHTPSLIILDVHMPGMNGLECLRRIRASAEWRGIPVVMHSADVNQGPMIEAEQLGVPDYVVKGVTPWNEFAAIIKRHVSASPVTKPATRKGGEAV